MRTRAYQLLFLVFVGLFCSCADKRAPVPPESQSTKNDSPIPEANELVTDATPGDRFNRPLLDAKGLIVLGENPSKELLRFYERDNSVWHEFTFYYDDSDGHFEYENENFQPFSFHPDYFILALRLMGQDSKYYEVIVNEEKSLRKYVKKNDRRFKFVTWESHILGTFAIDFDKNLNPIRQSPNGSPKNVGTIVIERYDAKSFDGDWLKVEWDVSGSEHDNDGRKDSGWIRWRDGRILLIDWFYFA
jgi:hypothetical protein